MLPQNTHSVVWIVALMFTALSYILCQAFSFLSFGEGNAIFTSSTGNISDVYTTEITPAGWTFSIWGVIYIFNACWLIHLFSTICRTSRNGGPVYNNPTIVSVVFLVVYTVNMLLNVSWLLLWDRTLFEVSLVILVLITLTLYICLVDYHVRINHFVKIMATQHKVDLILFRVLLQNGVSIYATWCTIATLLNLTIVLIYRVDLSQMVACIIALSILAVELLVFVVLDLFIFEKFLRYTFSTYLTVLWALSGSLAANWDPSKPHSIMSVALLGVTAFLLVLKIFTTLFNAFKKPLYVVDVIPTKSPEQHA